MKFNKYKVGLGWVAILSLLELTACTTHFPDPIVKFNPNPHVRYLVILETSKAPGLFESVKASLTYRALNTSCLAYSDSLAGINVKATYDVPVAFKKVSPTRYEAIVYADQLSDEDYYRQGVCHWSVDILQADLMHQGRTFSSTLDIKEFNTHHFVSSFMAVDDYNKDTHPPFGIDSSPYANSRVKQFEVSLKATPLDPKQAPLQ